MSSNTGRFILHLIMSSLSSQKMLWAPNIVTKLLKTPLLANKVGLKLLAWVFLCTKEPQCLFCFGLFVVGANQMYSISKSNWYNYQGDTPIIGPEGNQEVHYIWYLVSPILIVSINTNYKPQYSVTDIKW